MKSILILHIFLFSIVSFAQETSEQSQTTTYFFIRHAEKDLSDPNNKNPNLTEEGKERSENWAKMLADTPIDLVFSTDYLRTQQTAQPIAASKELTIASYNPRDLYNSDFQQKTKGKTSVIVGHSNTTPTFVNKILGKEKYTSIDEKVYGKLFIIKITDAIITDSVLIIN